MRKTLANLLAGTFGVIGNMASVASWTACPPGCVPGLYVVGAVLSLIYQCVRGSISEKDLESKVDALLAAKWADDRSVVHLAKTAGLGTDCNNWNEQGLSVLYAALSKRLREESVSHKELKQELDRVIVSLSDRFNRRLSALLLDQSNGMRQVLSEVEFRLSTRFDELSSEFNTVQQQLARHWEETFFAPRLSLNLTAYGEDSTAIKRLHYECRRIRLVGREEALRHLHAFLDPRSNGEIDLVWQLVTGPAGIGKSRLGLELSLQAITRGYDAGFLDRGADTTLWDRWIVERPLLVIIDYVSERATDIRDGIERLYRSYKNIRAPLRLLLLERSDQDDIDD